MRNIAIIAGSILILALAAACTGNEPSEQPDPTNTAQARPTTAQPPSNPAPTAEPSDIILAPTAAPVATSNREDEPTSTHIEVTRKPQATGNICWRTPQVQEKLIEDLKIRSCQLINEGELFRIRRFDVDTHEVKHGDFDNMPNLKTLQIEELRDFPEAGTFDGLINLEKLNV